MTWRPIVRSLFVISQLLASGLGRAQVPRDPGNQRLLSEEWFRHGHSTPGQTAAASRYRALLQKERLREARTRGFSHTLTNTSPWTPLGPSPLASDATGLGEQDYNWVSGRATAVAIDPADTTGNTMYLGGAYGGVWKSSNAGPASQSPSTVTWAALTDNQLTLAVGSIAIQPGNNDPAKSLILVGTGETDSSLDSYYGLGILRSSDAGTTWTLVDRDSTKTRSFAGLGFSKIAFSTNAPSLVAAAAAAASEGILEGRENPVAVNRGLYYSVDSGQNWTYASMTDNGITISPDSATTVVYNPRMGSFVAAMRYHGFYSSPDGVNWTRLLNQPGAGLTSTACPAQAVLPSFCPIYRGEIAVVPGRNEMYVWYVDVNDIDQGIWKTTDGGITWMQLDETGILYCGDLFGGCGTEQGTYDLALAAVPNGQATDLYAGAVNLYKCTVSGVFPTCNPNVNPPPPPSATFLNLTHVYGCPPIFGSIAHVHPNQHAMAFMLLNNNTQDVMYFANDGGIYRSLDGFTGLLSGTCGGLNLFDSLNQTLGSITQFVSFSQSPSDPNTILGGSPGNGSPATASAEGSTSWRNVNSADGGYNLINPNNPLEWFTENTGVSIQKCDLGITCHAQDFSDGLIVSNGTLGGDFGPLFTPFILDPSNSRELVVGTCRVWRGATDGTGFVALSGNFDNNNGSCTGNEVNQIRSLAAGGPTDSNGYSYVIYAGTDGQGPNSGSSPQGGHILVTTNADSGVFSWSNQTGPTNPNHYPISSIALDSRDQTGDTAYVTVMGFGAPHVWQTVDAGNTWNDFTANLPDAPANAVILDQDSNTIYVGTDVGVFASSTLSPNWIEVGPAPGNNSPPGFLPNVAVTALGIFSSNGEKLLRASTYGRGVWEYDLLSSSDFRLSVSNSPLLVFAGDEGIFQTIAKSENGYSGTVDLSCIMGATAPPPACLVSPVSIVPTPDGTPVTVTVGGPPGNYSFNLQGKDGNNLVHLVALTFQVFGFALGPPSPSIISLGTPATSVPVTFQVTAAGSFDQPVTLSCIGLPVGTTCNFSPSSTVTPTSTQPVTVTLTVNTSLTSPAGSSEVTIDAMTTNGPTATQMLTLTIVPDYEMIVDNPSLSSTENSPATFIGTLTAINGYGSAVNLTCGAGAPPSCTPNPSRLTPTSQGTPFAVTAQSNVVANYSFNILGSGTDQSSISHEFPVNFTSTSSSTGPDFTITVSNPLLSGPVDSLATFNGTLTALDGYSSAVNLTCSGNSPPSCSPTPITLTPTANGAPFKITVLSKTAGDFLFAISAHGTDHAQTTHSTQVFFQTSVDTFSFTNTTAPQTVNAGQSATYNLALAPLAGTFLNSVSFTCLGLPAKSFCTFNPQSIAAGSGNASVTLIVATSSATPSGTSTLTITADSGASMLNATPSPVLAVLGTGQGIAPFTINTNTGLQTVAAGQTATFTFNLSSSQDFKGTVAFACSALPASSTCSFSPAQIAPGSTSEPALITLQIATTAQVVAQNPSGQRSFGYFALAVAMPFGTVLVIISGRRNPSRTGISRVAAVALTLAGVGILTACGGGTAVKGGQLGTPAGTYTIVVSGTSGAIAEKATPAVMLSVQ